MPIIPRLSVTGARMSRLTGVRAIMKDIAASIKNSSTNLCNLSAGNPVLIPEVANEWRVILQDLQSSNSFDAVIGRYGATQGYEPLIHAVAQDFNKRYGTHFTEKNVLITPGSQTLYFFGANVFGGLDASGKRKEILLPLSPDYTGYGGVSIDEHAIVACKPNITKNLANHSFKYTPNLDALPITENTGAVLFSRPTNPSGNVISSEDVAKIAAKALPFSIPVFVDSAYGPPYPDISAKSFSPVFGENIIHSLSLSKAGLPGERIGIAIGAREYLEPMESFQSNACIHASRLGQAVTARAITSGKLFELSKNIINPYYNKKRELLSQSLHASLPNDLPWYLHESEGAMFGWLWVDHPEFNDATIYDNLKQREVLIVPGSAFFPGLREEWTHKHQCIRISLTASDNEIVRGCKTLGEELAKL